MAIETGPRSTTRSVETNGNGVGYHDESGRLPEDLLGHNAFIAIKATYHDAQPLDEVRRDLINQGVGDLGTQLRLIRRVVVARSEIRQAKERLKNGHSSE